MRRHLAAPLLAIGLSAVLVAGCSSSSQPKKTLTQVVTVTGSSPVGGSVTVISSVAPTSTGSGSPAGTGTASGATGTSSTPSASPTTASSPTTSKSAPTTSSVATTPTGKIVKVNPLKVDCSQLLDAQDVKKVLGVTISTSVSKIVDVANPTIGRTGLVRCRYGATSATTAAPVSIALANYSTPAAAKAQLKKTEDSLGGTTSATHVAGYPATVIIQDGGLLHMTYDTWTLSLAVADKLVPNAELPDDLTQLANMVLLRILKTA